MKRLVRTLHVEHLLRVQDRVVMFGTSVDSANEFAAVTSFFIVSGLQADHAESVLFKERFPVLSPEGPILAVLREMEHRLADGASSLLALDLRLRVQLEVIGEVVLNPVPPAMKQRMMVQLAAVIEAALLWQFAVHGFVVRAETNCAGVQASDETFSFVDASDDEIVTDVKVVSWFRTEETVSVVDLFPELERDVRPLSRFLAVSWFLSKTRERQRSDSSNFDVP